LRAAGDAAASGERDAAALRRVLVETIATEPTVRLDYAEVVDARTLTPVTIVTTDTLIAVAAFVGTTRLIDNITLEPATSSVDFGVTLSAADQETS
jgi:pantoate--beta-alanine ligase